MKNIRKRIDGRWEWRKSINNKRYSIICRTQKELLFKAKNFKPKVEKVKPIEKTFIKLATQWVQLYKSSITSYSNYLGVLKNHLNSFSKSIDKYEIDYFQNFLNKLAHKTPKTATYCYFVIKGTYKFAYQKDLIKKDISQFLIKPNVKSKQGSALSITEQKLILNNLDKTPIKNEILFYLVTGCRRSEAKRSCLTKNINFEKLVIFIDGTKTENAKRYVNISQSYAELLSAHYKIMFKKPLDWYGRELKKFFELLNIKDKKLHDLRHTFATNLFYLNVPDKKRQYLLGHASTAITNDIYTHLDPTITKNDILKLYNNLYPEF